MLMPVRCFSCGFPVAEYETTYNELLAKGKTAKEALDELQIKKYCCRRMVLSNSEYMTELTKFQK
jgi:DNA-directed RNA polymerase subunit N (RpoN/RPB10)